LTSRFILILNIFISFNNSTAFHLSPKKLLPTKTGPPKRAGYSSHQTLNGTLGGKPELFVPTQGQKRHQAAFAMSHGIRSRKKLARVLALIGMAFDNIPAPSSVPVVFVVQLIGADRFVVLSHV